ncbi:ABC transporter permease [Acidimangrovimonas sediminis]|uniref:ABC transporter permease n=1 Tax=Acidimangrovimonas sediminis TaxID=2056283 RepID=UPI000C80768F|nr:ABC transporter permease [Acidimangrovimonas sediminis]
MAHAVSGTGRAGRLGSLLWRRPGLSLAGLVLPPVAWMGLIYIAALAVLFIAAFWSVDDFTGEIVRNWTFANFQEVATSPIYQKIALRTVAMAALVTLTDAILAFPMAYFMARIAGPRLRLALITAVVLPLWSSYLARVYAWRLILAHDGVLNWALRGLGLPGAEIGYTNTAMWIVFSYIWLPFMIMPVYAALERIPANYFEASQDLGGRGMRTFLKVVLPLSMPGLVAGSIFTFSLTLGDYITPVLVGGPGSDFIGNVVYANVGVANNIPFAAAYATVPLVLMAVYLWLARRVGAFDVM